MFKITPLRIVIAYTALSVIWITTSDVFLGRLVSDTHAYTIISVAKGWLFIAVTAMLLYGLIHRYDVERNRSEQALRDSEQQFRFLVEHATDGIIIAQEAGLRFANAAMTALTGYTSAELTSRPFVEFLHPDDRELVVQRHRDRIQGLIDPVFTYSFRVMTKDGQAVWVETRGSLCTWNDRPATINFLTDITERRQAEETMLRAEKLESVGVLAGGIAHDFNNILTAVLVNLSLARARLDRAHAAQDRLTEAEAATLRASELTKQLLTFSRGGAPVRRPLAPAAVIRESAALALRGRGTNIDDRIPDGLWNIDADEGQIGQMINNLVLNASQAMAGGGTVTITARNAELAGRPDLLVLDGKYVIMTVEDRGGGIAPEHLPRIFDPYFTTKQEGSGLGLATSYSIVKNHGGMISVTSELGRGTQFTIYLPATDRSLPEREDAVRPLVKGQGRVLVMDDNDLVQAAVEEIICSLGYDVVVVEDGAAAVEAYRRAKNDGSPFDVVIMDLTVPGGMGGREAVRELMVFDPQVKAVVSSGYHQDPIMAKYREYGFRDVILKPYDSSTLSAVLARVTSKE